MIEINKIYNADCLDLMKEIKDETFDCVVTDPPYNLDSINNRFSKSDINNEHYANNHNHQFTRLSKSGFMGKTWDVLPSIDIWREVLRVMKPGAFAFIMCTPRQDSLLEMLLRLREAGFMIATSSIYWAYASGFPKAGNISKMIDKRAGAEGEKEWYDRYKDGGTRKNRGTDHLNNTSYKLSHSNIRSKPSTDLAKQYDGAFTMSLKPAVEVVIVAMKPLRKKTYIEQVIENGHGCVWCDACRIPTKKEDAEEMQRVNTPNSGHFKDKDTDIIYGKHKATGIPHDCSQGRFPANLICSDDALNDGKERKTTYIKSNYQQNRKGDFLCKLEHSGNQGFNDTGSFSRYFSLDAWFDEAIKKLPPEAQRTFPFLIVPKASGHIDIDKATVSGEKHKGCEDLFWLNGELIDKELWLQLRDENKAHKDDKGFKQHKIALGNIHCTTKAIKLMMYLITLGSRPNEIILDPFGGSGTTACAAKVLGRQYIVIEREKDYHIISKHREKAWQRKETLFEDVKEPKEDYQYSKEGLWQAWYNDRMQCKKCNIEKDVICREHRKSQHEIIIKEVGQ